MSDLKDTQETKSSRLQFWGAGIILLMIVLLLIPPSVGNRISNNAHGVAIGTANGQSVMSQDRQYALALLDILSAVHINLGPNQLAPLLEACWGQEVVRDFRQNPEALFLVLQESRKVSPGASPQALGMLEPEQQSTELMGFMNSGRVELDDLRPTPTSPLGRHRMEMGWSAAVQLSVVQRTADGRMPQYAPNTLPPLDQQRYYRAMNDFLVIQSAASLAANALKPSTPMVERLIASNFQQFTLEMSSFALADQLAKVGEPSEEQLQAQMNAFADRPARSVDRSNPFGFGYRVPDRVKLQLISFKRDDVRRLVESEKTPYQWEVAARMAFAKDPSRLSSADPTSQPTTTPAAAPSFEQVRDRAIALTVDEATDARALEIERRIQQTMRLDFQTWSAARATKAATLPVSASLGVAYDSPGYLGRLALDVQSKFKILPITAELGDRFRDLGSLSLIDGFNAAGREVPLEIAQRIGLQEPRLLGPVYATLFARDLMQPRAVQFAGGIALEKLEPSERLHTFTADGRIGEIYFFRLTDTQANHPAKELEPIRAQVRHDWQFAEAQRLALEQANAVAATIRTSGEFAVPGGSAVTRVTVGPFALEREPPPALDMKLDAYQQFRTEMTSKLLSDQGPQPVAVLNLPLAGRAIVARRVALQPGWTSVAELTQLRQAVRVQATVQMSQPRSGAATPYAVSDTDLVGTWLEVKQIFARNAWTPAGGNNTDTVAAGS